MTTAKKNVPLARKRWKKKKGDIKTLGKEDHVKQNRHCTLQLGNTLLNTAGAERGKKEDIALNRRLFRSAVHAVLRQNAKWKKKSLACSSARTPYSYSMLLSGQQDQPYEINPSMSRVYHVGSERQPLWSLAKLWAKGTNRVYHAHVARPHTAC